MGVENKKAVTTDPGEEPLTGPESCVTAFLLALHFQQCSHCITHFQRMQHTRDIGVFPMGAECTRRDVPTTKLPLE
jgi:hypothetical protein